MENSLLNTDRTQNETVDETDTAPLETSPQTSAVAPSTPTEKKGCGAAVSVGYVAPLLCFIAVGCFMGGFGRKSRL